MKLSEDIEREIDEIKNKIFKELPLEETITDICVFIEMTPKHFWLCREGKSNLSVRKILEMSYFSTRIVSLKKKIKKLEKDIFSFFEKSKMRGIDFSKKIEMNPSRFYNWKNGKLKNPVSCEQLLKIAKKLDL